jgi:hypothetical protein
LSKGRVDLGKERETTATEDMSKKEAKKNDSNQ